MSIIKSLYNDTKDRVLNDYLNDIPIIGTIGRLGGFGPVAFKVSEGNTLTPKEYSMTVGNDTISHSRIGGPPITEYSNRKLRTVNCDIKLIFTLAPVQRSIDKFIDMCELGEHYPLIMGNQKIGDQNYILKTFTAKVTKTDGKGAPIVAECSCQFEEYINKIDKKRTDKFILEKGIKKMADKAIDKVNKVAKETIEKVRNW